MELTGLGVDHVRAQCAGVPTEERVVERAVSPVEAGHVQPHQQHRQGVDQTIAQAIVLGVGEQRPVRQRVPQVPGHEDRLEGLAAGVGASGGDADERHGGQAVFAKSTEDVELPLGEARGQFLQGDIVRAHGQEAHDVAVGACRKAHAQLVGPVDERVDPRAGRAGRSRRCPCGT